MKYGSTHFEEYIHAADQIPLHPKLSKLYNTFPDKLQNLRNIILYGPRGVGKYTQALSIIRRYSPSNLKYEKKLTVNSQKGTYISKISDIHFEIDMSLLGCNSKVLWNDIYNHIVDVIMSRFNHSGIILCTNFQCIHSELLDNFYSYMQSIHNTSLDIKFIIITEQVSFIPNNILQCSKLIRIPRPSKNAYKNCIKKNLNQNNEISEITNIKAIALNEHPLPRQNTIICNNIINILLQPKTLNYNELRDKLYDIFIYGLDVHQCIFDIIDKLITDNHIKFEDVADILVKTYNRIHLFNNNYRPIYHLEALMFYLITKIHGLSPSM